MFEYFDPNPKNNKAASDCPVKAFCGTTGKDWDTVYKDLTDIGFEQKAMPHSYPVIIEYYKRNGFRRTSKNGANTVAEFCEQNPVGTFVLDLGWHVLPMKNGKYLDSNDCGNQPLEEVWVME